MIGILWSLLVMIAIFGTIFGGGLLLSIAIQSEKYDWIDEK